MFKLLTDFFTDLGGMILFVRELVWTSWYFPTRVNDIVDQTWKVTIHSLLTTGMAGFFVGAIMTVQFTMQMNEFGAMGYLGGLATSGTVREVGPLLIAFLLSGKIGAFTSAELGTMKVTEQIDAIRCLGANPMQEIIVPRFIGIVCASFLLLGIGLLMSVAGGMLLGIVFSGVSAETYLRHVPTIVKAPSVLSGTFKSFVFAIILATICTYRGYMTTGGAKGVGRSVVRTAVTTMVGIVVADWFTSMLGDIVLNIFIDSGF
jgi:phospholipid/cholesterol/gamma-HCH transport system permease protein